MPTSSDQQSDQQVPNVHDLFVRELLTTAVDDEWCYADETFQLSLPADVYLAFDWHNLTNETKSMFDSSHREKIPDLVFGVKPKDKNNSSHYLMLIEHKSGYESGTLVQLAEYQTLLYKYNRNPIMQVVLFHGKRRKWTGPLRLKDRLNQPPEATRQYYDRCTMNFECMLLNIHEVIESGRAAGMEILPALYALSEGWRVDLGTVTRVFELSRDLDPKKQEVVIRLVMRYLRERNPLITADDIIQIEQQVMPEDRKMMLHVFEDYKEGFLAEGEEKGLKKGREEGVQKMAHKVAASLIEDDVSDDRIQRYTELSLDEIAELREKLKNGA